MSSEYKRWRCPYCRTVTTSKLKPPKTPCSRRKNSKTGKCGFHTWERIG